MLQAKGLERGSLVSATGLALLVSDFKRVDERAA